MPGEIQPLQDRNPIAKPDGTPTDYFIRWAQQRQIDISGGITGAQAQQLINDWAAGREIIAGIGLSGGGNLSADVTINLDAVLDDLDDVDTSTVPPTDGQVLTYDEVEELWIPADSAGGGGPPGWAVQATGTGSSQVVTIPVAADEEYEILVFVDGFRYTIGQYSVVTNSVTLTAGSGDVIEIVGWGTPPPPTPGTSTEWRVYVTDFNGGALVSIAELYLYTSVGVDVATTGTPTQSSQYDIYGPSNFIDRNFGTFSSLQLSGPLPGWYAVTFASAETIIGFGMMGRRDELNNSPEDFKLQYFSGGVWTDSGGGAVATGQVAWGYEEIRDFYI